MTFDNAYADAARAESYARLEFPGTYYLAYRDLPAILATHVRGIRALDFGCGTGRSTRFLRKLGFEAVGVDISAAMVTQARSADPTGEYVVIADDARLGGCPPDHYDLVLSIFTFDNIPGVEHRVGLLSALRRGLRRTGRLVLLDSTPELYTHEWASFSTRPFPENAQATSGATVRVVVTDLEDRRPVQDVLWSDQDYQSAFAAAGLELLATYRPLGSVAEGYAWVNETRLAPWVIYVLKAAGS
jgi:SAM-dependent methyltransferase